MHIELLSLALALALMFRVIRAMVPLLAFLALLSGNLMIAFLLVCVWTVFRRRRPARAT